MPDRCMASTFAPRPVDVSHLPGAEPMTRGVAASSQPLGYYPMPPDILENDRKLSVVLAGPQPPIVDKDFARKWPRRLCSAGGHYDPAGHPVTADFRHLLFGHSPLQSVRD